jgi:hypothetical protein
MRAILWPAGGQFSVRRAGQAAVVMLLAAGAIGFGFSMPAIASGTSASHYGCYTRWWNTAWAQKCPGGAEVVGNYESSVHCSAQGDRYLDRYRYPGNREEINGSDCSFSVSNGDLHYLGY